MQNLSGTSIQHTSSLPLPSRTTATVIIIIIVLSETYYIQWKVYSAHASRSLFKFELSVFVEKGKPRNNQHGEKKNIDARTRTNSGYGPKTKVPWWPAALDVWPQPNTNTIIICICHHYREIKASHKQIRVELTASKLHEACGLLTENVGTTTQIILFTTTSDGVASHAEGSSNTSVQKEIISFLWKLTWPIRSVDFLHF